MRLVDIRTALGAFVGQRCAGACRRAALGVALVATPVCAETANEAANHEESVLVATREAAPADAGEWNDVASDPDDLIPVPQSSDVAPDMAVAERRPAEPERIDDDEHEAAKLPSAVPAPVEPNMLEPDMAPGALEPLPVEAVRFQGILAGETTRQEVISRWGEPTKTITTDEGDVLSYTIHPFKAVETLIGADDVVMAIKIALATPLNSSDLATQLSLDGYRHVTATDATDQALGEVFPERGVLFMYVAGEADAIAGDGKTPLLVSHVVLQPLDPQAFALRAESDLHGPYLANIEDLQSALEIDERYAYAHYLLAKIYLATGQADAALVAAERACSLEPDAASFQLCLGRAQELLAEYDKAVLTVRAVLDREDIEPIDEAQALYQMGRLASLGDAEITATSVSFLTRAIESADNLAVSSDAYERRAAKRLLVEAHMAMAEEIARHAYNDKIETLSEWVGRASGLAEEYIANDHGSVELRLVIAQRALAALASFRPTLDPGPWVNEAEEAAKAMLAQYDDELWQARVKWELGIAYLHALRVEHMRRETAAALEYGNLAVEQLAAGAASRQAVHRSEQLVGLLYFQMGAVYAVHELNHEKAATWYDKAEPLLTGPRPVSELYSPRREGEMLVSMGVSYWQMGDQARALDLTQSGVNLVELAVEDGLLPKTTLAVPYGNLATMYRKMGESASATKYADLAKSVAANHVVRTPRVGRAPAMVPHSGAAQSRASGGRR